MRYIITILFILMAATSYASGNRGYYHHGVYIHSGSQEYKKRTAAERPAVYQTKNWVVRQETEKSDEDAVKEALAVFKKRTTPRYRHQVWIYDKDVDKNDLYLEFMNNEYNKDIVFSPDEDFVYYLEHSPNGELNVYGVNLGSEEKVHIDAAKDFFVHTCHESKVSYVITTSNGHLRNIHVYTLAGKRVKSIDRIDHVNDLNDIICY